MNPRLISEEEKRQNRRRDNRRRHLRRERKRREALIAGALITPAGFTAIESDLLTDEAAFTLLFGRIDHAKDVAVRLHSQIAQCVEEPIQLALKGVESVSFPKRTLHPSRQGRPPDLTQFARKYVTAVHIARLLKKSGILRHGEGMAYFTAEELRRLLPGIRVPLRLRCRVYLTTIIPDTADTSARLAVFSKRMKPLFLHPFPPEWSFSPHDGPKQAALDEPASD